MRCLIFAAVVAACCAACLAQDLSIPPATIAGTRVETEAAAKRLAFGSYIIQMHGNISATEAVSEIKVITLGFSVNGFVTNGAKIWEARVTDRQFLRAILWINPDSEQVLYVCGVLKRNTARENGNTNTTTNSNIPKLGEIEKLAHAKELPTLSDTQRIASMESKGAKMATPGVAAYAIAGAEGPHLRLAAASNQVQIPGAKLSNSQDAQRVAFQAYAEKMRFALLSSEAPGKVSVVTLGFDIVDFAKAGDKVWEVRVTIESPDGKRAIRAILWVHPHSEKVHFIIGPWPATSPHDEGNRSDR